MADSPNLNSSDEVSWAISVGGAAIANTVQVVSIKINKTINRIPTAKVIIIDGDMPTQTFPESDGDNFKPGNTIEIKAGYGSQQTTLFCGIIVRHAVKISGENFSRLVVECRDKAVAMTIGRHNANFVKAKDSDIITKLIGAYSLTKKVDATQIQHQELVQYYCTDWDFMVARAEANGLLVVVDDGGLTVAAPDTSSSPVLTVTYGIDLMEFHAELDAMSQLSSVKGTSWDLTKQAIVEGQSQSPSSLNLSGNIQSSGLAKVVGPKLYGLQTAAPMEQADLTNWAKAQQLKAGLARISGRMKFQGSGLVKPGNLVELKGVGKRFDGNVFISSVTHEIADGNWFTEVEFGLSPSWFADNRDLTAPPAAGLLPGVEGLQIGVVKKLDGDPDGQQKIQVSIPVSQAETDGVWARLANFYASEGFGAFFIPEIGDEVILGHVNNDPSHPIVLGSLYSNKRKPSYELTADNFTKAIETKSQLKIEFDDDKKVITVVTPGNNKIVMSDDDKSIVIQDQNDNKVSLTTSGISMESPKDIAITAKGKVSIDATTGVAISSQADVTVKGMNVSNSADVGFTAKGNATAELSASGQTTIKGAMVMIN